MKVEFTEQERNLLIAVLKSIPLTGKPSELRELLQVHQSILDKLEKPDPPESPEPNLH